MPVVDIKGVGQAQFPDNMDIRDIRTFLRNKYYQDTVQGNSRALDPMVQTVAPYQPSLAQRLGGSIAEGLKGSGLVSDNYGAQSIGRNVASLGEFLPGIGDATAGDEFGRALSEGDKFGMAMAGLGVIPVAGDVAKKFVNTQGKNIDVIDEFDLDFPITHESSDLDFSGNIRKASPTDTFDGVFGLAGNKGSQLGGGEGKHVTYYPRKGKVADTGDLDIEETRKTIEKKYSYLEEDELDALTDAVHYDDDGDVDDFNFLPMTEMHERSWEVQNLRGLSAKDQGFDAIEMNDENGISYFIPEGSKAIRTDTY